MNPRLTSVLDRLKEADLPVFGGVELNAANVRGSSFGDTPLHIMAIWGDASATEVLIEAGAEVDACGEDGYTPLHEAVSQGKSEVVRLLMKHGANPYLKCSSGDAFELADFARYPDLKAILRP